MHESEAVTSSKTVESLARKRISYTSTSLHLSCVPPATSPYRSLTNLLLELECLQLILFDRQPIFGQHELPEELPPNTMVSKKCRQFRSCLPV